jgi:hypothetical protein
MDSSDKYPVTQDKEFHTSQTEKEKVKEIETPKPISCK